VDDTAGLPRSLLGTQVNIQGKTSTVERPELLRTQIKPYLKELVMEKKRVYNKSTGRDYKYDTLYQSSEEQKKNRASRNKVRREALRDGRVHKGDGKDIDHRDGNPRHNGKGNLRVMSKSRNRGKK